MGSTKPKKVWEYHTSQKRKLWEPWLLSALQRLYLRVSCWSCCAANRSCRSRNSIWISHPGSSGMPALKSWRQRNAFVPYVFLTWVLWYGSPGLSNGSSRDFRWTAAWTGCWMPSGFWKETAVLRGESIDSSWWQENEWEMRDDKIWPPLFPQKIQNLAKNELTE